MARQISFLSNIKTISKAPFPFMQQPLGDLLGLLLILFLFCFVGMSDAQASSRSLRLMNAHTKETATITYKRNGKFDADGLRKLNQFLRDWRRNEKTEMDPALFDLIWEVYKKTGAKQPITVFSGYRSPATNNMLRTQSKGVAKNSRHTMGQAMDFYLPGVPLATIRRVGLQMQAGGVGYYPSSRFIHIDTGNVRHWPRMTRKQLAKVFPDGVTVHVPTDGKPFSGYKIAAAQVKERKAEMARSTRSVRRFTQYASAAPAKPNPSLSRTQIASLAKKDEEKKGGLLQTLLRQTPKEPPNPQFTQDTPLSNSDPEADADADELLETGDEAQSIILPETLAALPKVRVVKSIRIDLAANETPAQKAEQSQTEAEIQEVIKEGEAEASETAEAAPLEFASLPRSRPETLAGVRYQLANLQPQPTDLQDKAPASALPTAPEAPAAPEAAAPVEKISSAQSVSGVGQMQMAALPKPRNSENKPAGAAQPTPAPQQNTRDMLAQMVGNKKEGSTSNRFAYAAANGTFLSTLPSDNQSSNTRTRDNTQLASLSNAVQPRPRPANNQAQPQGHQQAAYRDDLANLTFAYGPSGMAHFAHMKQRASTATFARLSRPSPKNLTALMYKPHSMINQGFAPKLAQGLDKIHFEGPAIARLSIRNFN
nr:DUF882 domain-containing protein [uncultured Cohaesibacter sp.]